MSAKAISEYDGKKLLSSALNGLEYVSPCHAARFSVGGNVDIEDQLNCLEVSNPWVKQGLLVAKPDQLIKRRGKTGLILLNSDWNQVKEWLRKNAGRTITADNVSGKIDTFIIEPFLPHIQSEEYYVCIRSVNEGDEFLFAPQGGVNVGDVDLVAKRFLIKPLESLDELGLSKLVEETFRHIDKKWLGNLKEFLIKLYDIFVSHHFTYLEINPLVQTVQDGKLHILDLAAKLDQTADFICSKLWGDIIFPAPFGREATPEEKYIAELDGKTGASLKLTVLNKDGRIWTMVAGGGASVAFSDAIACNGFAHELANYGEYSGAPSEAQTYEYAKTILDLMTRGPVHPDGKILFIGGGIANFTNVAATFKGIIKAIEEYHHELLRHGTQIYVRRAGPNYQEALSSMRELGDSLSLPIHVYGPEMHITGIVPLALKSAGQGDNVSTPNFSVNSTADLFQRCFTPVINDRNSVSASPVKRIPTTSSEQSFDRLSLEDVAVASIMNSKTRSLICGM